MKYIVLIATALLAGCGSDDDSTTIPYNFQLKALTAACESGGEGGEGADCDIEPWIIDNQGNIKQITDLNPNGSSIPSFSENEFNGKYYFAASDSVHGRELWSLDTSDNSVSMVKDIEEGADSSGPGNFFVYNESLYFSATQGDFRSALWKTDGTSDGTVLVFDPRTSNGSASVGNFVELNNKLFFTAYGDVDDQHVGLEWWVSDGSTEGTSLLTELVTGSDGSGINETIVWKNKIFFEATDGNNTPSDTEHSYSLFVSDGSANGTILLKDINPTEVASSEARIDSFTDLGERLIFTARDGVYGSELWVTDGTTEGTQLVKDITEGASSSTIRSFKVLDNTAYFLAYNGDSRTSSLWRTDGTSDGTTNIMDFDNATDLEVIDAGIIVSATLGESSGLWLSDGTEQGTQLFYQDSDIGWLNDNLNPIVYFYKNNELWYTDGSTEGTKLAVDEEGRSISSIDI